MVWILKLPQYQWFIATTRFLRRMHASLEVRIYSQKMASEPLSLLTVISPIPILLRPCIEDGSGTNSHHDSTWICSCSPKFQLADQPVWLFQWLQGLPLRDLLLHLTWMSSGSWHEWMLFVRNSGGKEDSLLNPMHIPGSICDDYIDTFSCPVCCVPNQEDSH